MKPMLFAAALLFAVRALAQPAAPEPTLVPGGEVKPDAIAKGEWIQGDALTAWEPGKVYMLECWATWCGPCIKAIPHVNELHKKFAEKGLRVIGVNVWEDGKDKVANFVKGKGDGMSYPVVYTGKGSAFETDWLKAGGVKGIPHAFLVRDGKLILKSHPARISEEIILAALEGGEALTKIQESLRKADEQASVLIPLAREFSMAANKKDLPAMEAAFAKVKEFNPSSPYVPTFGLEIALVKIDWEGVAGILPKDDVNPMMLMRLARIAASDEEIPLPLIETVTTRFVALTKEKAGPIELQTISKLQWKQGKKEDALASANSALEKAKVAKAAGNRYPVEPFEKFAAALGEGKMPTNEEFSAWMREAMPKRTAP